MAVFLRTSKLAGGDSGASFNFVYFVLVLLIEFDRNRQSCPVGRQSFPPWCDVFAYINELYLKKKIFEANFQI